MKIFAKRVVAFVIDVSLLIVCIVAFKYFLDYYNVPNNHGHLLLVLPYMAKDCLFGNASLGKGIMQIAIYTNYWRKPKFSQLIKRRALMLVDGSITLIRILRKKERLIRLFEWEQERLKTVIIDRKVYKRLDALAKSEDGYYSDNMTRLYNEYLNEVY